MEAGLDLFPGKATRLRAEPRKGDRQIHLHHRDRSIRHVVRRRSGEAKAVAVNPVCIRRQLFLYRCQVRTFFSAASQLSLLVRGTCGAGEARSYASKDLADSGVGANIISYSYCLEGTGTQRSLSATESTSGSTKAL